MLRRLILLAVILSIGTAPLAHAICQLTCETPAITAAHDHCSQPGGLGDADRLIKPSSDCVDQIEREDLAAAVSKTVVHTPMLTPRTIAIVVVGSQRRPIESFTPPLRSFVPDRTQLRV